MTALRTVRLCLLGFGNVARATCALLERRERALADEYGLRFVVTAAGTRHGSLLAAEGLAPAQALAAAGAVRRYPRRRGRRPTC